MIVHIYRNLRKNCWSVRHKNKVIKHIYHAILEDCTMHVQPAGRQKVLDTQQKNVHAYIKGNMVNSLDPMHRVPVTPMQPVTYDPYKHGYFYNPESGSIVTDAYYCWFDINGAWYAHKR